MNRRKFLRAAGITLALPCLDAFVATKARAALAAVPRRMVCVCTPLGLHGPNFFPVQAGNDYELTPYLDALREYRDDFTVISGLSHPGVESGHDSIYSFLT